MARTMTPYERELHAERNRRYRERHPERVAEAKRRRREASPEKFKEQKQRQRKAYCAKHKETRRADHRRYKLRRFGLSKTAERTLVDRVYAVTPRALPRDIRDEIVARLFEAVYSGRFPRRVQPAHAKEVLTEHFRMFTKFGPESLDAPRFEDGRGSLHDTISEGLWS